MSFSVNITTSRHLHLINDKYSYIHIYDCCFEYLQQTYEVNTIAPIFINKETKAKRC